MTQNKVSIEDYMERNKVIGQFAGVEPEIEYCVGNATGSCFHPKHCGYSWPGEQKRECERWISENEVYAVKNGYTVQKEEWWPWYNQDWNQLMKVVEKIAKTVAMQQGFTVPKNDYELDAFEILRRPIYTAISTIYDDAYHFITWYNTTLK